jgi:hypothetical protein
MRVQVQVHLTISPNKINALLASLGATPKHKLHESHGATLTLDIIDQNWGIDMSTFPFPHHDRSFRPDGDASSWDTRLLATIAILSEFTAGQAEQISTLLCNAVELRVGKSKQQLLVLKDIDVKRVIRDIMQPAREDEGEEDKELAKKRKSEYKQRKKGEKKAKEDDGPATMGEALDEIVMNDVNEGMGKVALPE